jgi:endo-1,4-beta-mannosidase
MKELWFYNQLCKGMVVWCYNDFMEPRNKPKTKDSPEGLNSMGIVTRDRKRKIAFEQIKAQFAVIKEQMARKGGY